MADPTDDGPVTSPGQVDSSLAPSDDIDAAIRDQLNQDPTTADSRPDPAAVYAVTGQPNTPTPQSVSVSGSFRGMTDDGIRRSGGLFGQARAQTAAYAQQDAADTRAQQAQVAADYQQAGRAVGGEIVANNQFATADARLQDRMRQLNEGYAQVEQRANLEAEASKAQYISAYREQLAAVRALSATTGNPLAQIGRGSAFGLAGAMFAQGFLAARGIHIDVGSQIDRWVDRSIAEHQQQISNARDIANDQLHLYDIARQNSQDEWEARQRYRGFVVAALQTQIQANANRFSSQIANAKAQESISKLQIEGDATENALASAHKARVLQMNQQNNTAAFQQGQLAIQSQDLALRQQEAAAKAKAAQAYAPSFVTDPSQVQTQNGKVISGGKRLFVVKQGMESSPEAKDAQDAAKNYEEIHNIVQQARVLRQQVSMMGGPKFLKNRDDPNYALWDQTRNQLAARIAHALAGARGVGSVQELKFWQDNIGQDDFWLGRGNRGSQLDNLEHTANIDFHAALTHNNAIRPVTKDDLDQAARVGMGGDLYDQPVETDPATNALNSTITNPRPPVTTGPTQSEADLSDVGRKDSVYATGERGYASPSFVGYLNSKYNRSGVKADDFLKKNGYRNEYYDLDSIAYAVANPNDYLDARAKQGVDIETTPDALRQHADALLRHIAATGRDSAGHELDSGIRDYASYLVRNLDDALKSEDAQEKQSAVTGKSATALHAFAGSLTGSVPYVQGYNRAAAWEKVKAGAMSTDEFRRLDAIGALGD